MLLLRRLNRLLPQSSRQYSTTGNNKVVVTAALNGVFTDPKKFQIPVTAKEMANEAEAAYNEGASVVHIHFRDQRTDKGHLPSWEPEVAKDIVDTIRARVPQLIINSTTGTIGETGALGMPLPNQPLCNQSNKTQTRTNAYTYVHTLRWRKTRADRRTNFVSTSRSTRDRSTQQWFTKLPQNA